MPAFVVAAVEFVGGLLYAAGALTVGNAVIVYAAEIAMGATLLGGAAYSGSQRRKAERQAREAYNAAQVDRMQNVVTTIGQRELVMGRVRKSGTVFARASTGENKEKFCMAIALAGHEIDAVETIYFNDKAVELDIDGNVITEPYSLSRMDAGYQEFTGDSVTLVGTVEPDSVRVTRTEGTGAEAITYLVDSTLDGNDLTIGDMDGGTVHYQTVTSASKAQVRIYLGTDDQAADAEMMALFPGAWTSDHRARGVAYLVCEFDYDETAFPSGIPAVSAVIRGAKLFDPRDDTTAWSENPALMARHVLTHEAFGKRSSITAAEDARIAAAANACDLSADYVVDGVTETRELFKAGYVVPYGSPAKDVLDDLTQAMGGMWAYAGGEFFVRAGAYTTSVLSLTDDDLAVVKRSSDGGVNQQPIVIGTHKAQAEKLNVITPRIWDEGQDYKQVALTPLAPASLITRDGNKWLAHELDMPAVTYAPQALHIAGIILRDDRDAVRVTLPFKLTAYPVELFDVIDLTIARYGWAGKEFLVLGRTWTLDGLVQLTLKEIAPEIYEMDAEFDPQGYAENTNLPRPWEIYPPENITITSGGDDILVQEDGTITVRVRVEWDPITDLSLLQGGSVEIRYRLATEADWHTVIVPAAETYVYLIGGKAGQLGFLQARCRNSIAVSDWSVQQDHTIAGKTDAPGAVTSLAATGIVNGIRITGILPTDSDLAFVELYMGSTNVFGSATKITQGLATQYDQMGLSYADGTKYFWTRAVDTSGNVGSTTGPVSATAGVSMGAITSLSASGISEGIRISGTLPSNVDLAYVELWEGTTNVLGSATLLTRGVAASYDRKGLKFSDGTRYYWTRCVSTSGVAGSYTGPVSAAAGATPNDVTGLAATAINGGVRITGSLPSDIDLAGVEVSMASSSSLGAASVVATGLASSYDQMGLLPADGLRYFWVRTYNTSGRYGSYVGPVSATALGVRGALVGSGATYSISSGSWSDAKANRVINNILVGASSTADLATTTHLVLGDTVTLTNSTSFIGTKFWTGSAWTSVAAVVQGNVLVQGTGTFTGDINGGANINITGMGKFGGATTSSGNTWAGIFNEANAADGGVTGYANTGVGINGKATGSGGVGTWGVSSHASGFGVKAGNSAGGVALDVDGKTTIGNYTVTWNGRTIAAPGNVAWKFLDDQGNWTTLAKGIKYVSGPHATAGASLGYIIADTFDGVVGQCKIQVYAL